MTTSALSEFDEMVSQMVAMKIPRHMAEAAARRKLGLRSAGEEIGAAVANKALEKAEQSECVKIYRAHGCVVYSLSQPRATKQSPGLPDLVVFAPRYRAAWWHEVKRPVGGVPSPAQVDFQQRCAECGVRYVIGDRTVAWNILREIGAADATS